MGPVLWKDWQSRHQWWQWWWTNTINQVLHWLYAMIKIFCLQCVISSFCCEVYDICARLGYYAAYYAAGSSNPRLSSRISWPLKKGLIVWSEMSKRITTICRIIAQNSTELILPTTLPSPLWRVSAILQYYSPSISTQMKYTLCTNNSLHTYTHLYAGDGLCVWATLTIKH
jgi:hypothetical protein